MRPPIRLSVTGRARSGRGLDDPGFGRTARARDDQSRVRAVRRQRQRRFGAGQVRARAAGQLRLGEVLTGVEIAQPQPVVALVVDDPGEHPAVVGDRDVVDVLRRLLDPLVAIRGEVVERETAELAACIGDHVKARTVAGPRPRGEDAVLVVRRQLTRAASLHVDEVDGGIAVVPGLDGEQLRAVGRPWAREREHLLAEHGPRLTGGGVADPALHVGGLARIRGVGELRSVPRPGTAVHVVLDLRLVRQLLRPAPLRMEQIELVKLVAVVIGADQDAAVARRDCGAADGLVRERRELIGPASLDGDPPEIELTGEVAGEQQLRAVCREGQGRGEAADGEKLLHERQLSRFRDGHGPEITVLKRGAVFALGLVCRRRRAAPRGRADFRPLLAIRGSPGTDRRNRRLLRSDCRPDPCSCYTRE